jgi:two-component system response regulator PilR (NtrC family)
MSRILVVDDEASLRELLEIFLQGEGYAVDVASSAEAALGLLEAAEYHVVITDLKMPGMSGLELLRRIKSGWPDTQVVLMTAYSTTDTAIDAMKSGAYDYVAKPFKVAEMLVVVQKALERCELQREVAELRGALSRTFGIENLVGKSPAMQSLFDVVERVCRTRTSVLITGESGTGKELVAKAIHYQSPRQGKPFVVVNCGAIPENLMESELFGHVRGAFTGAVANKKGLFEAAHGGTLFLDEVGELPLAMQVKLLRALQERRVKPVGATGEIEVDVRVLAATNRDLQDLVRTGEFREDLYYRLNVIHVAIPPLRQRREDIPFLAHHFVQRFSREMEKIIRGIAPEAMELLVSYSFPGNVRELENIIERAITFETEDRITSKSLPRHVVEAPGAAVAAVAALALPPAGFDLEATLADIERGFLQQALGRTGNNRTEAARLLGISFRAIRYKLAKYGLGDDSES